MTKTRPTFTRSMLTVLFLLASCGGGGGSATSTDTFTVSGSVLVPSTSTNLAVQRGASVHKVLDASGTAAAGYTATFYANGESLGTATVADDGTVTGTLEYPSTATAGTYDGPITMVATNSDGSSEVATIIDVSITPETAATAVDMGVADGDTTVGAYLTFDSLDCTDLTSACNSSSVDTAALFLTTRELLANASSDSSAGGVSNDYAVLRTMILGGMASGSVTPSGLGAANWGSVIRGVLDGTLAETGLTAMAQAATTATGVDITAEMAGISDMRTTFSSVATVMVQNMGASSTLATLAGGASGSYCADGFANLLLSFADASTMTTTMTASGAIDMVAGLLETSVTQVTAGTAATAAFATFTTQVGALVGYMASTTDYSTLTTSTGIAGVAAVVAAADPTMTMAQQLLYGQALADTIADEGGFSAFVDSDGTLNTADLQVYTATAETLVTAEGTTMSATELQSAMGTFAGSYTPGSTDTTSANTYSNCLSTGTVSTCSGTLYTSTTGGSTTTTGETTGGTATTTTTTGGYSTTSTTGTTGGTTTTTGGSSTTTGGTTTTTGTTGGTTTTTGTTGGTTTGTTGMTTTGTTGMTTTGTTGMTTTGTTGMTTGM